MKNIILTILLTLVISSQTASAFDTRAKNFIIYDHQSGDVILEKDSEKPIPPASMSKLMTLYVLFDKIKDEEISLDDTLSVSEKAWKKGGSKMFVKVGTDVKVRDLIQGIVVQSGNDACIVVAEGLAGSEDSFADAMNEKAEEIGLENSTFANATGWPDENHRMSLRDLLKLSTLIMEEYPDFYKYFAQKKFTYNKITQRNRNKLLGKHGVDGLKTGHTQEAGYGLVASAINDGRRITAVVSGLGSEGARATETERLLRYGFKNFKNIDIAEKGQTLAHAKTWYGTEDSVTLVAGDDIISTIPKYKKKKVKVRVAYHEPIFAPIAKGQHIADLVVSMPDRADKSIPLYAGHAVEEKGWLGKKISDIKHALTNIF